MRNLWGVLFLIFWSIFLAVDIYALERFLRDIDDKNLADFPHTFNTFVRAALFVVVIVYAGAVELSFSGIHRKRLVLTIISAAVCALHILTAIGVVAGQFGIVGRYQLLFTNPEHEFTAVSLQNQMRCCGWDLVSVPAGSEYCSFTRTCHDALADSMIWRNGINACVLVVAAFVQCIVIALNVVVPEGDYRVYTAISM